MLQAMTSPKSESPLHSCGGTKRVKYRPPASAQAFTVQELFQLAQRPLNTEQGRLFPKTGEADPLIFLSGNVELLKRPSFSVIGARSASPQGLARARRIARELAKAGVVVTSGLAKGIDTAAHTGALEEGGSTVAVIGTPLQKCYPAENGWLQEEIYQNHLLVSQFAEGTRTFPSDFPKRNRLMAALSNGSIIVEASDTSGTLHQAVECTKLGRWLFIMKSVVDDNSLEWPTKFLQLDRVRVLSAPSDVFEVLE